MKFFLSHHRVGLLAAAAAAAVSSLSSSSVAVVSAAEEEASGDSLLEVGQRICVEGYVMDYYCIERGRLLDNNSAKTLEEPYKHSVHCLVDVQPCYQSPFEILIDPTEEGGLYARGFRMTEEAQDKTLEEARSVGRCSTCDDGGNLSRGFRAAFDATIVDLGDPSNDIPKTIEATQIKTSNDVDNPCEEFFGMENLFASNNTNFIAVTTPSDNAGGGTLRPAILAHGALMLIGWGLLLPSGAIIAKFFKHRPDGLWYKIHKPLQITGLVVAIVGWIIALRKFDVFSAPGFKEYYHGIMGCTVMSIGIFQPLNALLRPHHPPSSEEEEPKSSLRLVWEIVHKSLGWIAILLAVATIVLGTTFLQPSDASKFQYAYGIGCGGCLLLLIVYICYDKSKYNNDNKEEQERKLKDVAQPPEAAMMKEQP